MTNRLHVPNDLLVTIPRWGRFDATNIDASIFDMDTMLYLRFVLDGVGEWFAAEWDGAGEFWGLIVDEQGFEKWDWFSTRDLGTPWRALRMVREPSKTNDAETSVEVDHSFTPRRLSAVRAKRESNRFR